MSGLKQRFLGLCVPPLLLSLLDNVLTLAGQSSQYWAGGYSCVNEGSPTFFQLLQTHPAAFIAGGAAWVMVFILGILLLPDMLALIVSIAVSFGHASGSASWLMYHFHCGYQMCNGFFLLCAVVIGLGIRWGWHALPDREYRHLGLSSCVRWGVVGLLFSVAVYLYLWPRNIQDGRVAVNNKTATRTVDATVSTDRELEQLGQGPPLARLCLSGPKITSAGLERIKEFPKLQNLSILNLRLTDNGLKHIQGLGDLKWLSLENVEVPEAGLKHLAGLTQLEGMTLRGPQVTDAWLEHLKGLFQLRQLHLEGTQITDAGLANLEGLNQLQNLNLTGTRVSNDGMKHLQGMSQLRWLYLAQTKITDAGLEHLKGLTRLETLYILITNCTPEGEKKFQQSLPKCGIVR